MVEQTKYRFFTGVFGHSIKRLYNFAGIHLEYVLLAERNPPAGNCYAIVNAAFT